MLSTWNAPAEACAHPRMLSVRSAPPEPIDRDHYAFCRLTLETEIAAEKQQRDEGVRDHHKAEEGMHHLLLEHLASFDLILGDPELRKWFYPNLSGGKKKDRPPPPRCYLFRIKLYAKTAKASWSRKETPRFYPDQPGATPIHVARLVEDVHGPRLENAGAGGRPGAISVVDDRPWWPPNVDESEPAREVAVLRRFHHGATVGLALTSHITCLGLRLHDKLFLLPHPSSSVTLTFCEGWFYLPSKWTEERLYARVGLDFIDIASTLEKLLRTLYQMYQQEEQDKKMARELEEQERRRQEELESKPLAYIPLGWGSDHRWESPDQVMHRRYELSLDADERFRCHCVEQEGPCDMRKRIASDRRFVLPLTTTSLEVVGFVEGYLAPETLGFTEQRGETEKLRPVVMAMAVPVPHSDGVYALIFKFLADRIAIRLDDGFVLTGWNGICVDIHRDNDDVCRSHISIELWTNLILEWRADDDSPIPCSCLLVQLSRKLSKLNESITVSEEKDLGLDAMFAVEAEDNEGHEASRLDALPLSGPRLGESREAEENEATRLNALPLSGPKLGASREEDEGEYSLLFASPGESDWVKVSEPYVPKFPTEEEICKREEMRKEQLKRVMEPITRPVSEPRRGWNYFMDRPGTQVTVNALPPQCALLWDNWPLSDKSESWQLKTKLYPSLTCLEWCNCVPMTMLQVYTLELIVADSIHPCKLDVSGFVAIRDFLDGQRNYIFNREMSDPLTAVSDNGVLLLPTMSPRRVISRTILLEFDLKVKRRGDGIDSYLQLIQGVSEHPGVGPYWSRVNNLSIRSDGDRPTPMMRVKLAMISTGVEATIELRPLTLPSWGIALRCTARTGWIADDLVLFDGRYGRDNVPMQFVVASELSGDMEIHLEGASDGASERERWCMGFEPKFHAIFSQAVEFSFGHVLLSISWSS